MITETIAINQMVYIIYRTHYTSYDLNKIKQMIYP